MQFTPLVPTDQQNVASDAEAVELSLSNRASKGSSNDSVRNLTAPYSSFLKLNAVSSTQCGVLQEPINHKVTIPQDNNHTSLCMRPDLRFEQPSPCYARSRKKSTLNGNSYTDHIGSDGSADRAGCLPPARELSGRSSEKLRDHNQSKRTLVPFEKPESEFVIMFLEAGDYPREHRSEERHFPQSQKEVPLMGGPSRDHLSDKPKFALRSSDAFTKPVLPQKPAFPPSSVQASSYHSGSRTDQPSVPYASKSSPERHRSYRSQRHLGLQKSSVTICPHPEPTRRHPNDQPLCAHPRPHSGPLQPTDHQPCLPLRELESQPHRGLSVSDGTSERQLQPSHSELYLHSQSRPRPQLRSRRERIYRAPSHSSKSNIWA